MCIRDRARGDTVFSIGLTQGSGVINMQTTKGDYNPGESILLMGNTGSNSLLTLTLFDSNETAVKKIDVFSDKNGGFRTDKFRIPNDPQIGQWSIKAKSGGNTAEHAFTVSNVLESIAVLVAVSYTHLTLPTIYSV